MPRGSGIASLAVGLCLPWGFAQMPAGRLPAESPEPVGPKTGLRADSNLVLIPAVVYNAAHGPVTSLRKENFRVYEDRIEQPIRSFTLEDAPIAVGLVFDTSGSMGRKLSLSRRAASEFCYFANRQDEFFLVEFNDNPKITVPLTRDIGAIRERLLFSKSSGRTALIDAVMLALNALAKSTKDRKALLIISDGGDNNSRYNREELRRAVRESDALIYAVGIYGGAVTPEEIDGPDMLRQMATQTGGRCFEATAFELPDIAAKIGRELRSRYVLGYAPVNARRDGRYHAVEVKVIPPRGFHSLHVAWRRGYYAAED